MCELVCPYKPCGSNENCIGCMYDPEKRELPNYLFWDMNYHLGCGDCRYCNPKSDMDSVKSPCKRLDHKHYQFAVPWFKSYDCGQHNSIICSDFEPKEWRLWLYRHWKPEFLDDIQKIRQELRKDRYIGLCIDKDQSVRYYVKQKDFYNNTFKNEDGSLKWLFKRYYKKSKKSPIGYELITKHNYEVEP